MAGLTVNTGDRLRQGSTEKPKQDSPTSAPISNVTGANISRLSPSAMPESSPRMDAARITSVSPSKKLEGKKREGLDQQKVFIEARYHIFNSNKTEHFLEARKLIDMGGFSLGYQLPKGVDPLPTDSPFRSAKCKDELGKDLDLADFPEDTTLLMLAAAVGEKRMVELLLEVGGRGLVYQKNSAGEDAWTIAKKRNHRDVCDIINRAFYEHPW